MFLGLLFAVCAAGFGDARSGGDKASGGLPLEPSKAAGLARPEADPLDALFKTGVAAMGRNDWDAAEAEFNRVLELDSKHLGALIHLGGVAQRKGDWVVMETRMREALRAGAGNVDNVSIWIGLGFAGMEQEKWEPAMAAFAQAVALDPANARARRLLALTLGRRGWFHAAEEEMRRALQLEPDDAGAHFNLAVFYLQRQPAALELARRHYYRALDLGFAPDAAVEEQLKSDAPKDPAKSRAK